jgi:hypothetical protein
MAAGPAAPRRLIEELLDTIKADTSRVGLPMQRICVLADAIGVDVPPPDSRDLSTPCKNIISRVANEAMLIAGERLEAQRAAARAAAEQQQADMKDEQQQQQLAAPARAGDAAHVSSSAAAPRRSLRRDFPVLDLSASPVRRTSARVTAASPRTRFPAAIPAVVRPTPTPQQVAQDMQRRFADNSASFSVTRGAPSSSAQQQPSSRPLQQHHSSQPRMSHVVPSQYVVPSVQFDHSLYDHEDGPAPFDDDEDFDYEFSHHGGVGSRPMQQHQAAASMAYGHAMPSAQGGHGAATPNSFVAPYLHAVDTESGGISLYSHFKDSVTAQWHDKTKQHSKHEMLSSPASSTRHVQAISRRCSS